MLSFSFGETLATARPGAGGGGGAGKVEMSDFTFTARTSKASPQLFLHCAQGKHIKQAVLTVRKAGQAQQEYLKIKLNDVLVSSYAIGGCEEDVEPPDDAFSLNFVKIAYDYFAQKSDGSLAPRHARGLGPDRRTSRSDPGAHPAHGRVRGAAAGVARGGGVYRQRGSRGGSTRPPSRSSRTRTSRCTGAGSRPSRTASRR